MSSNSRKNHDPEQDSALKPALAGVLTAEAYRQAKAAAAPVINVAKSDDRISLFWCVFGGTLLCITTLVAMTVYQQISRGINELCNDLNHGREAHGNLIKKDEFNARSTSIWNALSQIKDKVPSHEMRLTLMAAMLQSLHQERKELSAQVHTLREKITVIEARQDAAGIGNMRNGFAWYASDQPID